MAAPVPDEVLEAQRQLAAKLFEDPDARKDLERHTKRLFPKASIPQVELREEADKVREEIKKEREEWDKERSRDKWERERTQAWEALKKDPELHVTDEEIPEIEKLMQDELIGNHRTAARYYRAQQQVAAPSGVSLGMSVPGVKGAGGDYFKGIVDDPDAWARGKSEEILNDFARGQGNKWI